MKKTDELEWTHRNYTSLWESVCGKAAILRDYDGFLVFDCRQMEMVLIGIRTSLKAAKALAQKIIQEIDPS